MTGATTIVRQDVNSVAGDSRNIVVTAAGGRDGLNGTHPRRVTAKPLKARHYPHFDEPLDDAVLASFERSDAEVAAHPFFPLLAFQKTRRTVDFSVFPPVVKAKPRNIKYAAHADAALYGIYARKLGVLYEEALRQRGISDSVLAYRSGVGYNVPIAGALFDEIRACGGGTVLCVDVSKFFDRLGHGLLKARLGDIVGSSRLPPDWHAIFRRMTTFEYVEIEALQRQIGRFGHGRICDIDTFRKEVRPLIKRNADTFGIPQGTPLSGAFANLYMINVDQFMHSWTAERGGSYRRYSDDIAIRLPTLPTADAALEALRVQLSSVGLDINEDKTCVSTFTERDGAIVCSGKPLQYLGFNFDGTKTLIRSESMKVFYARMKSNIRRYVRAAHRDDIPIEQLRKRVLVGRFTHWGDSRNFVQYAYRAARELNAPEIKRQLRNHVPVFNEHWSAMVQRYYKTSSSSD